MRSLGDAYLSKYDEPPGKELQKAFHGLNTLRRTGRSVASMKRTQTARHASPSEVVEHGRWRLNRSSLDMPLAYLQWSIDDRLCITQFSLYVCIVGGVYSRIGQGLVRWDLLLRYDDTESRGVRCASGQQALPTAEFF
jgi:hypothetical protein